MWAVYSHKMVRSLILACGLSLCLQGYSQVIQIDTTGRQLRVPCILNGNPLNFVLDTANTQSALLVPEALFLLKNQKLSESDFLNTEYFKLLKGDVATGAKVILRELSIGGLTIKNLIVSVRQGTDSTLLLTPSTLTKIAKVNVDLQGLKFSIPEKQVVIANPEGSALDFFLKGYDKSEAGNYSGQFLISTKHWSLIQSSVKPITTGEMQGTNPEISKDR